MGLHILSKGKQLFQHIVPGVIKPLHILWNEVIGFLFMVLALITLPSLVRHYRNFNGDAESMFRIGLTATFALIMLYFGVSSFLKAKKIGRS